LLGEGGGGKGGGGGGGGGGSQSHVRIWTLPSGEDISVNVCFFFSVEPAWQNTDVQRRGEPSICGTDAARRHGMRFVFSVAGGRL